MSDTTDLIDTHLAAVTATVTAVLADPSARNPISPAATAALRVADQSMIGGCVLHEPGYLSWVFDVVDRHAPGTWFNVIVELHAGAYAVRLVVNGQDLARQDFPAETSPVDLAAAVARYADQRPGPVWADR
jgi:hypothetical protein